MLRHWLTLSPGRAAGAALPGACLASALALALVGCHPAAERQAPLPKNVVDRALLPLFAQHGISPVAEDDAVLCRRLAVDLTGIVPTADELRTHCQGAAPEAMATYLMNKPSGVNVPDGGAPYVYVNRRWWADKLRYRVGLAGGSSGTFYPYLRDLDALVGSLYAGSISYDTFARRALASPGFVKQFGLDTDQYCDDTRVADYAAQIFLGRPLLVAEQLDFGGLWAPWRAHKMTEAEAEAAYPDCPVRLDPMTMQADSCVHLDVGVDGSVCQGTGLAACQSTVFGAAQVVPSVGHFVRYQELSAADLAALEAPGRLLALQPDFAAAAVDAALVKYLGWWRSGRFQPDFDVPAVREALAAKFIADGYDVRKMELEIVSSVLYAQRASQSAGDGAGRPLWAYGPTNVMYAEAWLDSLAQATGKKLGGCDFRYTEAETAAWVPGAFHFPSFSSAFNYGDAARDMGGCPAVFIAKHTSPSGLVAASARRSVLGAVCPGAFSGAPLSSASGIVDVVFAGLGRPPRDDEKSSLVHGMTDASQGGCKPGAPCDTKKLAGDLCGVVYASAAFTVY